MRFTDPESNLKQFSLKEGMSVADLGAGSGFYTLAAAKIVSGMNGKVYAIEVQKELLPRIKNEASKMGLSNVEVIWGNIEKLGGTKLRDSVVDAAIISNVLFQVEDKISFVKEVKRILKSGGRVLLIDWQDSFGHMGPHPDHVVSSRAAQELFERQGFSFDSKIEAGPQHYGMILRK